mgnify:CR=1 FL=1
MNIEYKGKKYSTYTSIISNIFIRMLELNPTNGEIASNIFSIFIRNEMELSAKSTAEEKETGSNIIPTDMQDLYDDVIVIGGYLNQVLCLEQKKTRMNISKIYVKDCVQPVDM